MAVNLSSILSYQRLNQEILFADEVPETVIGRLKNYRFRRVHIRRRLKVRIPGLKRFVKRKSRLVKVVLNKVYKRLKESKSHFGDLFAGNYLFMQVTPTPLKIAENRKSFVEGYDYARYSIPRIA